VLALANDHRTPKELRGQAIRSYGRLAPISAESGRVVVGWFGTISNVQSVAVNVASQDLVSRCRHKFKYIREVYPELGALREALVKRWALSGPSATSRVDDRGRRALRAALLGVEEILVEYANLARNIVESDGSISQVDA
jgi:hypothetical protein